MHLTNIYERPDRYLLLYDLLREREDVVSISHKGMPCYGDHKRFVDSGPYRAWFFMVQGATVVGACYLSQQDEIGVAVFKSHRGNDYGRTAVSMIMNKYGKRRYLANINPWNGASIAMFAKLGFRHCQNTYESV